MDSRKLFTFTQLIQTISSLQAIIDQCAATVTVPTLRLQELSDILKVPLDGPFIYSVLLCFFCFRDQYTFQYFGIKAQYPLDSVCFFFFQLFIFGFYSAFSFCFKPFVLLSVFCFCECSVRSSRK